MKVRPPESTSPTSSTRPGASTSASSNRPSKRIAQSPGLPADDSTVGTVGREARVHPGLPEDTRERGERAVHPRCSGRSRRPACLRSRPEPLRTIIGCSAGGSFCDNVEGQSDDEALDWLEALAPEDVSVEVE